MFVMSISIFSENIWTKKLREKGGYIVNAIVSYRHEIGKIAENVRKKWSASKFSSIMRQHIDWIVKKKDGKTHKTKNNLQ